MSDVSDAFYSRVLSQAKDKLKCECGNKDWKQFIYISSNPEIVVAGCKQCGRAYFHDHQAWKEMSPGLTDNSINISMPATGPVCDFCSESEPAYASYQAKNFTIKKPAGILMDHHMDGAWAACRYCSDLIDHDDWKELEKRCVDTFVRVHKVRDKKAINEVRALIHNVHEQFRKNRQQST